MRKLVAILAASAALAVLTPAVTMDTAMAKSKAKSAEDATAPSKHATSPSEGVASGEKGSSGASSGSASQPSWDETYKTDKAQEEQLKAGGK